MNAAQRAAESRFRFSCTAFDCDYFLALLFSVKIISYGHIDFDANPSKVASQ